MSDNSIEFLRSPNAPDVVLKLSDYDGKLTCDGRVMRPIEAQDSENSDIEIVITHKMMKLWNVTVKDPAPFCKTNFTYIDWIAMQTNKGFHIIQKGPTRDEESIPTDFNLSGGEEIVKIYVYIKGLQDPSKCLVSKTYVKGAKK